MNTTEHISQIDMTSVLRETCKPSSQVSMPMQSLSKYALLPKADQEDVCKMVIKLQSAFPNMPPEFWTVCTEEFRNLSKQRLQLIYKVAVQTDKLIEQYRYNRLCVADFLSIDEELETLTQYQVSALRWPHEPVVIAKVGKKFYYCFESAAKASGYEYEPYVTDAQREHEDAERRRSLTEEELAEIAEEREKFFKKYNVR